MWDDQSFDSNSFSTLSWWLDAVEVVVRAVHKITSEVRRLVVVAEFRRIALEGELRSVFMLDEGRVQSVEHEDRQLEVFKVPGTLDVTPPGLIQEPGEIRVLFVNPEVRAFTLAPEQRVVSTEVETRKLPVYNQL